MPEADALIPGLPGAEYVALAGELYGMPRRKAQRRAHEVLTYLDLEDARYRRLEEYSTGMKQRLKLAQALVHDPPVLASRRADQRPRPGRPRGDASAALVAGQGAWQVVHSLHPSAGRRGAGLRNGRHPARRPGAPAGRRATSCAPRRQDRYRLQIQGDTQAFLEELRLEGVAVLHDNGRGELRVAVPPGWMTRAFFALADNHSVLLRGLQRDDEDLEELFHRVIGENGKNEC